MAVSPEPAAAMQPEDLGTFFIERANAGDVDGLVALYEPGAVLAFPPGQLATGHEEIRAVYTGLLAGRPGFSSAGSNPSSGMANWRSPRRGCPAVAQRSRWPAGSRTAAGDG